MKLIINTTTLVMGGALQVAVSFLNELKEFGEDEYHVFLSMQVRKQLRIEDFPEQFKFYFFENSPAGSKHRKRIVGRLKELEGSIKADVVFTVFGPSYWTPTAPHVMGVADGWCYNPKSVAWSRLSLHKRLKVLLLTKYKSHYFKRDAQCYIGETEDVCDKISRHLKIPREKVHFVSNTCGASYLEANSEPLFYESGVTFKLLVLSANYGHKNLKVISEALKILQERGLNVEFQLTLPDHEFAKLFPSITDGVKNLGVLNVDQCIRAYTEVHALFLPTLLESFTATYPEAMALGRPIITSDLSFARSICCDAAAYFNPLSAESAANVIQNVIEDRALYMELSKLGYKRVKDFPSAEERARKYIELIRTIKT